MLVGTMYRRRTLSAFLDRMLDRIKNAVELFIGESCVVAHQHWFGSSRSAVVDAGRDSDSVVRATDRQHPLAGVVP